MCRAYVREVHCAVVHTLFRHDVIRLSWPRSWQCVPSALNANVKTFKKARANGGSNYDSLKDSPRVSAAADRRTSYGNQTITSTWSSCWIKISTVDVINTAADHQMFMTLTGELSWQHLRWSAIDYYSNKGLANAKKLCDCSVLCPRPQSLLCSSPHCILEMTSYGIADSKRHASNNGIGQFKPIFQVERNTSILYFGLFHSWLTALQLCRWKFSYNETSDVKSWSWSWS